jgi:Sec-independent protein translocase protein TatA
MHLCGLAWCLQQAPKQFKRALDTAKMVFNQLSSSLKQQDEQRQQQQKQQAKAKQEQAQVCVEPEPAQTFACW